MTTPHEAVNRAIGTALADDKGQTTGRIATAAIEALREGAVERFLALNLIAEGDLPYERSDAIEIVNAILGSA